MKDIADRFYELTDRVAMMESALSVLMEQQPA